ncbi:MAG: hypothetical protein J0I12_02195 [Candidatus Eremiobacteraeota bacterium]|nr:hypothetical protein [Candidatus Eremiobacteraeota bacterium]
MKRILLLIILALFCLPALAEDPYDNLTVLATASTLTDEDGKTLQLMGFHSKYKEKLVGLYFAQGDNQVRFYMNEATWLKFRSDLLQTQKDWGNLQSRQFEEEGQVLGYKVGNRQATLRLSIQGATDLSAKRLMMNATGGASGVPLRISVALKQDNLNQLVEDFHKIDDFLTK